MHAQKQITCTFFAKTARSLTAQYKPLVSPSPVAQSVARPIADPEVVNWILAPSHTFMEIDNQIFSMVILLLSLIEERLVFRYKGKYVHKVPVNHSGKSVVQG